MKKEELLNIEFDGQSGLSSGLREFYNLKKPGDHEVERWPYKNKLSISIKNVIGKKLYNKKDYIGTIDDCYFGKGPRGHSAVIIKSGDKEYSLTESKIEMYNKFSEKDELIDLHPSRKGIKFWSNGHVLSEKDYKSLYYKTKEYRSQYEKSLNKNLGTTGLKAPIQYKKIKDKISKTMDDRYGVSWFLERGCHYSAVTMTMQDKFGVDNLFYSDEWQREAHKMYGNGISKLESSIIDYIIEEYGDEDVFCFSKNKEQVTVVDSVEKRTYRLDYVNTYFNVFIEIMGDYWHCNPDMYDKDFFHPQKEKYAYDIWKYDNTRIDNIKKITGYNSVVIWENDWNKNKGKVRDNLEKIFNEKK